MNKILFKAILILVVWLLVIIELVLSVLWIISFILYHENIAKAGEYIFDIADNIIDYLEDKLC